MKYTTKCTSKRLGGLVVQISNRCNSNCIFCVNGEDSCLKILNLNNYKKALSDYLSKNKTKLREFCVKITGGEPLLELNNVLDMIKFNKSIGVISRLSTSGQNYSRNIAIELSGNGLDSIQVSLDAVSEDIYDKIRGTNLGLIKAIECIEISKNIGLPVVVRFTLCKENLGELLSVYELCVKLNVDEFQIKPLYPIGRTTNNSMPTISEIQKEYISLANYEVKTTPVVSVCMYIPLCHKEIKEEFRAAIKSMSRRNCPCATFNLYVSANGEIFPCNFYEGPSIGMLSLCDLEHIWDKNSTLNKIKNVRPSSCDNCISDDSYLCGNQCPTLLLSHAHRHDLPIDVALRTKCVDVVFPN